MVLMTGAGRLAVNLATGAGRLVGKLATKQSGFMAGPRGLAG